MEIKMFHFIVLLIKAVFLLFSGKKKDIIIENMVLIKELEIIKRKNVKRIKFKVIDKLFYYYQSSNDSISLAAFLI